MASGLQCGGVGLGVHHIPEPTHTHPTFKHVLSAPSFVEAVSTLLAFSWWKIIWQNVKCFCRSRKLETTSLQTASAAIHNQFGASELPHGRAQRQDKPLSSFSACFSRHKKTNRLKYVEFPPHRNSMGNTYCTHVVCVYTGGRLYILHHMQASRRPNAYFPLVYS